MAGRFGSVITAMVTPFRDDYALDLDGAQSLAAWLLENGTDGLVVAGSTGEAPTLTHQEKRDLFRGIVEAAKGKGKVICGTGTYDTAETIELTRDAEKAGADAVLVVTPYYNRPPQRGLIAHFTKVADSTALPVILYNIPGRTACLIETDTLLRLAEVDNIVAVKDATGDFQMASRIVAESPAEFEVYSGDAWATFPLVCLGEVGRNMAALELAGRVLVIDAGLSFPPVDMPGIDLVLPDFQFLRDNRDRLQAVVLTPGHEDHVGSLPYLLREFSLPVYATTLTLALLEGKLEEHGVRDRAEFREIVPGQEVRTGPFIMRFHRVAHSIPDGCAVAVDLPEGVLLHSGDFKLDPTPMDGLVTDLQGIASEAARGVQVFLSDSTNAEDGGTTGSERSVGP